MYDRTNRIVSSIEDKTTTAMNKNGRMGVSFHALVREEGQEVSGGGSNKAQKRSSSDSPSASATNDHGCDVVDKRLRSVLCHPLGLPLMCAFNDGLDPSTLLCLSKTQEKVANISLDKVLSDCVYEWRKDDKKLEEKLTTKIARKISENASKLGYYAHSEVHLKDDEVNKKNPPRIDVLLSPSKLKKNNEEPTTPYAVVEFGLDGMDWSKKLDQNVKYMDLMVKGNLAADTLLFNDPILFGVVTVEDVAGSDDNFEFKIGVFLCSRRDLQDDRDEFRMSLLWHAKTSNLEVASGYFGRLLQVTHDFSRWMSSGLQEFADENDYQYLSSSCCKCKFKADDKEGDHVVVLRSYDNRARTSLRNPEIYLDETCQTEVGVGKTNIVASLFSRSNEDLAELDKKNKEQNPLDSVLWDQYGKRPLTILSTPYREGKHFATTPRAFLPIVRQLKKLHAEGFVHGDIRAFNTVFGENPEDGWFIDYDFGGKEGTAWYPEGYKTGLTDGDRLGVEGEVITAADDWYALGQLIFDIHKFRKVSDASLKESWLEIVEQPSAEDIDALENFLEDPLSGMSVTLKPSFLKELNRMKAGTSNHAAPKKTLKVATGTPINKTIVVGDDELTTKSDPISVVSTTHGPQIKPSSTIAVRAGHRCCTTAG